MSAVTAKSGSPFVKVRRPKRELDTTFQEFRRGEQFTDERKVCAATVRTPPLHNVDCGDGGNACTGDGKHAMATVRFELRPNAGYSIVKELGPSVTTIKVPVDGTAAVICIGGI